MHVQPASQNDRANVACGQAENRIVKSADRDACSDPARPAPAAPRVRLEPAVDRALSRRTVSGASNGAPRYERNSDMMFWPLELAIDSA